jgi:hypothetical protein
MPIDESETTGVPRCAYCDGAMFNVMDHARECMEMHISAKECMPDEGRGVFDYIEMPCDAMVKRWKFTEHVADCMDCAVSLAMMMYGTHGYNAMRDWQ